MEEERQREEALRKRVGVLSYEGHMEKKSPAHNQWQVLYCNSDFGVVLILFLILYSICVLVCKGFAKPTSCASRQ